LPDAGAGLLLLDALQAQTSGGTTMPKRNPMARALRKPLYRAKRTPTKTERLRKLERKHRGRPEASRVIDERTN
jgi:hypothetical protein